MKRFLPTLAIFLALGIVLCAAAPAAEAVNKGGSSSSDDSESDSSDSDVPIVPPFELPLEATLCVNPGTADQETMTVEKERALEVYAEGNARLGKCVDPTPPGAYPEPAVGAQLGAKTYSVLEAVPGSGVFWITEGVYTMMFVVTAAGVVVVDAPPNIGMPRILQAIDEVAGPGASISDVIYSHSHADHIASAGGYPGSPHVICHEDTQTQLDRARPFPFGIFVGGGPVPNCAQTFTGTLTFSRGTHNFQLETPAENHDPGNIIVLLPDYGVMNLVDIIFPRWSPFKSLAFASDWRGYVNLMEDLHARTDWTWMVTGHLNRLADHADVDKQIQYIKAVEDHAAWALQNVDFFAIAGETGFDNPWLLFETYLETVGQFCTDRTLADPRSAGLGGLKVFTKSHCDAMLESLRID